MAVLAAMSLALGPARAAEKGQLVYVPGSTKRVGQLTGDLDRASGHATLSQTGRRFGVHATDLGSSFEHEGKLHFLFGDTVGRPGARDVLAWTKSDDPAKIELDFHRAPDGKWLPLTVPGIGQGALEVPSGGIAIGGVFYVVFTTDHTERVPMGRSVLAASRDDGRTFARIFDLSREKFINVSFRHEGDWLYVFGSGDYRRSNLYLARFKTAEIERRERWEFLDGVATDGAPRWSANEAEAVPLFDQPQIGEFSVAYLEPVKRYAMLYNAREPRGITLRSAAAPWGPWSESAVIFHPIRDGAYGQFMHISSRFRRDADQLSDRNQEEKMGAEYGPYVMSRYTRATERGCRVYFTLSTWNPYQVMVMQTDLELVTRTENR